MNNSQKKLYLIKIRNTSLRLLKEQNNTETCQEVTMNAGCKQTITLRPHNYAVS